MPATRFRKKPVEIDAIQWVGPENCEEVFAFIGMEHPGFDEELDHSELHIPTLEGTMTAVHGDWIIRGVKGEFYPCKPDIFDATYEPVAEQTTLTVYDAHGHSWWGLSEVDRARFTEWLKNEGYEPNGRTFYRVEIHAGDAPFARVFAYALDDLGRKYIDSATGEVAEEAPHDVPISSLPPVQPGTAA